VQLTFGILVAPSPSAELVRIHRRSVRDPRRLPPKDRALEERYLTVDDRDPRALMS
jgi:hypothetical protein